MGVGYLAAKIAGLAVIAGVYTSMAIAGSANDPSGTWVMDNGKVTVRLARCSDGLCAQIVDLKERLDKSGSPKIDRNNPDPALRHRPLIGMTLASLASTGADVWVGSIYNPDDGRTYAASMRLSGRTMQVKGCVAGILCKTNSFMRTQ
jgi:uncharacterized protein (DUF2147 family)